MTSRADLADVLARISDDVAADLVEALTARLRDRKPSRSARLDERDAAIRETARTIYSDAPSRQEAARRLDRDLTLFRPATSPRPPTGRAAALGRILNLCAGKPPGRFQIENILAGHRRPRRITQIAR